MSESIVCGMELHRLRSHRPTLVPTENSTTDCVSRSPGGEGNRPLKLRSHTSNAICHWNLCQRSSASRASKLNCCQLALIILLAGFFLPLASLSQQAATTLAGSVLTTGGVDGPAAYALFHDPTGLAMDASGNVYVADNQNHTLRKLSPAGLVTTLAGHTGQSGSANGTGTNAYFCNPSGIALAASGTLYVSDTGNNTIRSVSASGVVTTLAGLAGQSGTTNGAGNLARFNGPLGIAVDHGGTIYVADSGNHTIRKITPTGAVTSLAGSSAVWGSADGTGSAALFNCPVGVAVDGAGNIFVSDANNYTIRKITPAGVVSTWAGLPGVEGAADGTGNTARFGKPAELKFDQNNNLYVVDSFNCVIRKIAIDATVTTVAGLAGVGGAVDGLGPHARFFNPYGLAIDHNGNLRVSDTYNETIRFVYSPFTVALSRNGNHLLVNWQAVAGNIYQVQYQQELSAGTWENLGGEVTATTNTCHQADTLSPSAPRRFYRVLLKP
jgi:hypothetical protein